jgi:hypothetical protein
MAGGRARHGGATRRKSFRGESFDRRNALPGLAGASWSGPNGAAVAEPVAWGLAAAVRDAR